MRAANASLIVATIILCLAIGPAVLADTPDNSACDVNVDFNPVKTDVNTYALGVMEQQCDAENGYRVFADGGEPLIGAIMHVSGRPVDFDDKGTAVLVETTAPGMGEDTLVLTTKGAQPNTLSFRIEAKI